MVDAPLVPCRSCGGPVWWAVTEAGKRMPMDAGPHPDGNVLIVGLTPDAYEDTPRVRVLRPADLPPLLAAPRYRSHFATCPDAARHRRRS